MNLRQAIEAGAQRVSGRCRHEFLIIAKRDGEDVEYQACAWGAAYLGCHPDADLVELVGRSDPFWGWVDQFHGWYGAVMSINDALAGDGTWEELFNRLNDEDPTFVDREICNPGERTASEPATSN